ncbi:protein FAM89A-like [Saccoglossus kowalevskii]|uniref:Protein FAM89A-like n=1 Tax=Saccoglossus kowalevskii TaxID=10224 RepID=A0ABM0GIQ5_SACKO|nr:PREDICTED: protein FAM89A-like [Saccoglossus kowalevskii]
MATNSNTVGPPANIPGLPALPKSLSGLLNVSSGTWRETGRIHAMKTMIQDDYSRANGRGRDPKDKRALKPPPGNLDAALAILRKEMVGLRQLDMSLLCQLWSLNESIQEYKSMCLDSVSVSECATCENGQEDSCPLHQSMNGSQADVFSDLDSELASPRDNSKGDW